MKRQAWRRRFGMTLMELLTVVIIVGILAALAIPQYFNVQERAKSAEAFEGLGAIRGAQQRFRAHAKALLNADRYAKPTEQDNLDMTITDSVNWKFNVCVADAGTDCTDTTAAGGGTADKTGPNAVATSKTTKSDNTNYNTIWIDLNTGKLCSDTGLYLLPAVSGNCK